jgi:hypothetical protein
LIQPIYLEEKPFLCSILRITWCSTVSKAFSKSSLRMTISLLEEWQMCGY